MTHSAPLVGSHFRPPAKALIQSLPTSHPLELRPEPSNPYDANAVAVWLDAKTIPEDSLEELRYTLPGMGQDIDSLLDQRWWQLGYIAKEVAAIHQQAIGLFIEGHNVDATVSGEGFLWSGLPCTLSFAGDGKPQVKFNI